MDQKFYTANEADAQQAAMLLKKAGGRILSVNRTDLLHRFFHPRQRFVIRAEGVPLEAMRAFLRGE